MEYCTELRSRGIAYTEQKEGRLTGLLTSCHLKDDTEEKI
jgi:hypothetical protein